MSQGYSPLEGTQEDINRRLLRRIMKLESEIGADDKVDTVKGRIKALEDAS